MQNVNQKIYWMLCDHILIIKAIHANQSFRMFIPLTQIRSHAGR